MSRKTSSLAAAPALMAAWVFAPPAQACQTLPASASLCSVVPVSAVVRDKPNGHATYGASGKVLVAANSRDGLWARIEVPCIGYKGWIARKDLACESASASANAPAKP